MAPLLVYKFKMSSRSYAPSLALSGNLTTATVGGSLMFFRVRIALCLFRYVLALLRDEQERHELPDWPISEK